MGMIEEGCLASHIDIKYYDKPAIECWAQIWAESLAGYKNDS